SYFFVHTIRQPPYSTLFPYTTLFRSIVANFAERGDGHLARMHVVVLDADEESRRGFFCFEIRESFRGGMAHAADVVGEPFHERRSEEHTSELQSRENLVCRLLLEKKK